MRSRGAASALAAGAVAAAALAMSASAGGKSSAGVAYGGVTKQGWPVVVEVSRDRRKVVRTLIGLDFACTTGMQSGWDRYNNVPLSRSGKLQSKYGPVRVDRADGKFEEQQGHLSATINRAGTKVSGTWQQQYTIHDATTGAVTDACNSGEVRWTAKQ